MNWRSILIMVAVVVIESVATVGLVRDWSDWDYQGSAVESLLTLVFALTFWVPLMRHLRQIKATSRLVFGRVGFCLTVVGGIGGLIRDWRQPFDASAPVWLLVAAIGFSLMAIRRPVSMSATQRQERSGSE